MVSVACAIAVLSLVSVSHTAPLACDCEELVRPLDQLDPRRLVGRWALVAGSLSYLPYLQIFGQRDSAAVNFSSNTSETQVSYTRGIRTDKCHYGVNNISLEGSSFTYDGTDKSNLSGTFVHTSCPDCLLMRMNVESVPKRQHFYLFSRRRRLEPTELEEFRAQVKCLNMPEPVVMDPTKELCPEEETQTEEGN